MKTKLFLLGLLCFNINFGQNSLSLGPIPQFAATGANAPVATEIFRFRPGLVTQLDDQANQNFGFTDSRWFSMGRFQSVIAPNTQSFYGMRFQIPNSSLVMGYVGTNPAAPQQPTFFANPRIQWIGNGSNTGNLEFRVADSFNSTSSTIAATMTKLGDTFFGNDDNTFLFSSERGKVNIINTGGLVGLNIENPNQQQGRDFAIGMSIAQRGADLQNIGANLSAQSFGVSERTVGLYSESFGGANSYAVDAIAVGGEQEQIAIRGRAFGNNNFAAGVYGSVAIAGRAQWAGFFDGRVFATGGFSRPSDRRFKQDIQPAGYSLERLAQLKPVTYTFVKTDKINLESGLQNGFIAQDVEKVFPELVTEISKPVYDKNGKLLEMFNFKSVDYMGLISVLTKGIQELNEKVVALEKQLAEQNDKTTRKSIDTTTPNTKGAFMQQNIPNPFGDQTTITYQLPEGTSTAEIMVFDLTGKLIKTYAVDKNQSELTIKASDIGNGLFTYSLVQNGEELLSKKMVVKS